MTSITWAGPRCVQELATFLGPQNRTQGRCGQNLISEPSIQNLLHRYRYYLGGGLAGEVWRNLAIWTCITVMQHRGPPPPSTNQPFYKQTYFPSDHSDIQIFSGKVFLIEMLILRVHQASQCAACDWGMNHSRKDFIYLQWKTVYKLINSAKYLVVVLIRACICQSLL